MNYPEHLPKRWNTGVNRPVRPALLGTGALPELSSLPGYASTITEAKMPLRIFKVARQL
jgi:hypothetical protein